MFDVTVSSCLMMEKKRELTFKAIGKLGNLAGLGFGVDGDAVVAVKVAAKVVVLGHGSEEQPDSSSPLEMIDCLRKHRPVTIRASCFFLTLISSLLHHAYIYINCIHNIMMTRLHNTSAAESADIFS